MINKLMYDNGRDSCISYIQQRMYIVPDG